MMKQITGSSNVRLTGYFLQKQLSKMATYRWTPEVLKVSSMERTSVLQNDGEADCQVQHCFAWTGLVLVITWLWEQLTAFWLFWKTSKMWKLGFINPKLADKFMLFMVIRMYRTSLTKSNFHWNKTIIVFQRFHNLSHPSYWRGSVYSHLTS